MADTLIETFAACGIRDLQPFTDAESAVARIHAIYDRASPSCASP